MSKPPKEQARDYVWHNYGEGDFNEHNWDRSAEEIWLAGYKAAQEQVADVSKVMPQWISVKDRLPPDGAKVLLIVFGDIHYGWIDQSPSDPTEYCLYFSNTYIDKGHHALTHWMPIPLKPKYMSDYVEYEPPKEEK